MSRVGKKPVSIPSKVKVTVNDAGVSMEGPKGSLSLAAHPRVKVGFGEDEKSLTVTVDETSATERETKAMWGTTRALLANMVEGVLNGYERKLEIVGVGWGGELQGQKLKLNVGYANPVFLDVPQGVNVDVQKTIVTVTGADKQSVGQFAAEVRGVRPPEPYNGKGVKYADEVIRRKEGKKFGA